MRWLVDTSVWSLALRKKGPADHPAVQRLTGLLEHGENVVLTGLILQEILQAFREPSTLRKVAKGLEPFALLSLSRSDYEQAARLHRACASRGIAASTADCQIAAAAIEHDCILLTADKDFGAIARGTRLQVDGVA